MANWIKAMDMAALPENGMKRVELESTPILLVNRPGEVRAYGGDCPHAGAPLDEGALCEDRIVCPWHKAAFALSDGHWLEPPTLDSLSVYPVRIDGGAVFVELDARNTSGISIEAAHADTTRRLAVIGGGAAGAAAVATLLQSGFGGTVTLFAVEPQSPYDRTCLSKFVPSGEMAPDEVPPILPEAVTHDARLRIEHVKVKRFDVTTKKVMLSDGREEIFDAVLVATGSIASRPDIPGADLDRVFTLRDVGDASAILNALEPGEEAVILGDSFIGLETASALRTRGVNVTVVSPSGVPLEHPLGARVGALFREWHEANGIVFRRAKATRFERTQSGVGVSLDDGNMLFASAVIAGIGVSPATQFLSGVGLEEDGGVPVDATMRVAGDVYAAGDIACFPLASVAGNTRIEHWRVAQQTARIAALNMLGQHVHYEGVPFFWTQHYGKRVDYLGHAAQWDDLAMSGQLGDERFAVLYSKLGVVQAVLASGYEREVAQLSERLREPLSVESARGILGV